MYQFDVALSYEGKAEKFVQEVADYLIGEKWNVFFAPYYKKELLSENLKSELYQIYEKKSLIKVLFITERYLQSEFTRLEARRAVKSAEQDTRRLIVVNFIGKNLPEHLKKYVYLDYNVSTDEIADLVSGRVQELKGADSTSEKALSNRAPQGGIFNYVENNNGAVMGNYAHISNLTIN